MQALAMLLFLPLMILNVLGGLGSGVWLAFLGEWKLIGFGLGMSIGGTFLCSIALLPGMALAVPGAMLYERGGVLRVVSYPIMLANLLWTLVVMSLWAILSFYYFMSHAHTASTLPYAIWAYGVACGPWVYMASKESNEFSTISAFFLQIASLCMLVMLGFLDTMPITAITVFLIVMAICLVSNGAMAITMVISEAEASKR